MAKAYQQMINQKILLPFNYLLVLNVGPAFLRILGYLHNIMNESTWVNVVMQEIETGKDKLEL
jgi:hypothetical protein